LWHTAVDKAESEAELADLVNHQAVAVIAEYAKAWCKVDTHFNGLCL
jgi:dTDP-4-dehydrorhamnose reductase